MTTAQRLPRSLDPAPSELLPGYLLRLAHRLDLSPHDLAERCGLTVASVCSASHLIRLTDAQEAATATVCGLTHAEVRALTLSGQAPGYAPLHPNYLGRVQTFTMLVNDGWVFARFSRYCPQCLADSPHPAGSGSVWSGLWRLPLAFACPRHHRLLHWTCPACGNLAFSARLNRTENRYRASLLPNGNLRRLHPTQCRSWPAGSPGPCGQRLDHVAPHSVQPTAGILATQALLLDAAVGRSVISLGETTTPERFFNDLRAVLLLIRGTWPTPTELWPAFPHFDLLPPARAPGDKPALAWSTDPHSRSVHVGDAPPADTRTAAALTTLAVQLLTAGPDDEELIRLLEHRRIGWPGRLCLQQLTPHTSPALARALQNTPPLGKPRPRSAARRVKPAPGRHDRFEARHIPARLPHKWTAPLTGLDVEPTALHRDAALQLVQMSLGLPRLAAARYLGLSPALLQHTTSVMNRSLHQGHRNHEYGQILIRLADLVSRLDAPIDYHRRRQDPRAAGLPASDWAELADTVRTHTSTPYHGPAWWSPPRHLAASIVLWTHLTHGELELAPALQTYAGREEPERLLREARWIQDPGPQDRVRQHLRDRLLAYAAQLAHDIDSPHRERMLL